MSKKLSKLYPYELDNLLSKAGLKLTTEHLYVNDEWDYCDVLHLPDGEKLVLSVKPYEPYSGDEELWEAKLEILKLEETNENNQKI